jgi:hypothetical protein
MMSLLLRSARTPAPNQLQTEALFIYSFKRIFSHPRKENKSEKREKRGNEKETHQRFRGGSKADAGAVLNDGPAPAAQVHVHVLAVVQAELPARNDHDALGDVRHVRRAVDGAADEETLAHALDSEIRQHQRPPFTSLVIAWQRRQRCINHAAAAQVQQRRR